MSQSTIDSITEKVMAQLPPGVRKVKTSVEKSLRVVLEELFAKMELVTREEFDTQTKVLQRTAEQLNLLEKKIAELEKQAYTRSP